MQLQDLTEQQCLDIYNANFGEELEVIEIERSPYGLIEMHKVGCNDDMMLTISKEGSLYLFCLDNSEIYHDVLGALSHLKYLGVEPFA